MCHPTIFSPIQIIIFVNLIGAVMGSLEHSLSSLSIHGSVQADGESFGEHLRETNPRMVMNVGPGGGSGGTILLFIHSMALGDSSIISTVGGHGSPYGGGGGGGGRVHFHWSDFPVGDEYLPIAHIRGSIQVGCVSTDSHLYTSLCALINILM